MADPFTGQITMFAGNFAPRGWALCDGQLLAVSQNDALFSLLGTIYGGDGRTTFGLPDLRGRVPIHHGSGPGLTPRALGNRSGVEKVTLTTNQLPSHTHPMPVGPGDSPNITNRVPGNAGSTAWTTGGAVAAPAMGTSTTATGGLRDHNNIMPFQCVNFIIALFGVYPSRS